ncbi:hypothetical protein ACFOOM_05540 [Streptomyces echinoruber]|uniref:Serine/arginine repetitive matrix protein 2 n=1 Tax=Streptomyces echinoruber TaxID=68898 RepID=A0A918RSB1_9ACTN|nr:hypothetical protein [Streptomyces echinoruber]GHA08240.1 hypothetical protein GCM10010389_54200 [Streptomyces echinoruber]
MSGGHRRWNEETQSWEDADDVTATVPVTPPPPAGPEHAPGEPTGSGPYPGWSGRRPVPSWWGVDRRTVWSVVAGAAVAGVAVSLVLTLGGGNADKGDHTDAAGSPTAPSAPGGSATSYGTGGTDPPSLSASPTAPTAPPSGYHVQQDQEGFRVAVPDGWSRTSVASQFGIRVVNYRSPDRTHRLQVYQVMEESPDASFELFLSPQTPKPAGFEKLSLENLDGAGFTGSRLEYLADRVRGEPDVGTWHVYDERFVAADGQIYALAAYGPDADGREDELKLLTTALAWFCPPGMSCGAAGQD